MTNPTDPRCKQAYSLRQKGLTWPEVAVKLGGGISRTRVIQLAGEWEHRDDKPVIETPNTPPCVFCGEPTHIYVRNDGRGHDLLYTAAVMCRACDSHGPIAMGCQLDDVQKRAVAAYARATEYRDRLVTVCQRLVGTDHNLNDVLEQARLVLRDFQLSKERR